MAGMLYSLVALGFAPIYKASACSTLPRARWCCSQRWPWPASPAGIPKWTGIDNPIVANLAAFVIAGAIMFVVAWLIEKLALRHLVNQEGATLLMATLGITDFLEEAWARRCWQRHLQDRCGHAQGADLRL